MTATSQTRAVGHPPVGEEVSAFIVEMLEHWNSGTAEEFLDSYRRRAPAGLLLESPVGAPPVGWEGLEQMCAEYHRKVRTENVTLIVNGSEAAAVMSNVHLVDGKPVVHESIETYRFNEDGTMLVRYFHPAP